MPDPVWNGQGYDPWLPTRLRYSAQIAAAERSIFAGYWSRLSAWLVEVTRAVLRPGQAPDPLGVYATVPMWQQSVQDFTHGPVRDTMARAYASVMFDDDPDDDEDDDEGWDWDYDSRPAVATYLAQVPNRMVRTPDETFDLIAAEVTGAANDGESIPEVAERIAVVLDATGTERWRNRATVVARTETMGALNAGRDDAFTEVAADLRTPFERMWLATDDTRTRPTHADAEGQRAPLGSPFTVGGASLMRPGDPTGPPQEVIQCRCTTLLVAPGEHDDLSTRQARDTKFGA